MTILPKSEYKNQVIATCIVTIITFCHGIGLGWLAPMLGRLQSPEETPLSFTIDVAQMSWVGALVCFGGLIGNSVFGPLLDCIGRKPVLYMLAIPHMFLWVLLYFAKSVEFLYVARVCGGMTGGAIYLALPIFIGEIANPNIRGRLTSMVPLNMNTGILVGYIISSHVPYHLIPCIAIVLPLSYLVLIARLPETPQQLLRHGHELKAEESLKFYRNYKPTTKADIQEFNAYFTDLKAAISQQKVDTDDGSWRDLLNKQCIKAMCTGIIIMVINIYSGYFAILNYTSNIFVASKAELDPNTNTIIIGVVQIVGTYTASIMVDRFGRKILIIISTAGMGIGLAVFGMYAFFAEETDVDLSSYSSWVPLVLVGIIIFIANIGIIPVSFVVLVEIMPPKIRSKASSFCLALLSVFAFGLLKSFPIFMDVFGLSAAMWFCATVCALGLFYISLFLKETKGKSMDKE